MRSPDSYTTATINAWCKQLQRPHASGVQQRQGSSLVSGWLQLATRAGGAGTPAWLSPPGAGGGTWRGTGGHEGGCLMICSVAMHMIYPCT